MHEAWLPLYVGILCRKDRTFWQMSRRTRSYYKTCSPFCRTHPSRIKVSRYEDRNSIQFLGILLRV